MTEMVREFSPNGVPIMIDGLVIGDEVIPESIRIFPILGDTLGYPFFGHKNHSDDLVTQVADRLTQVHQRERDKGV